MRTLGLGLLALLVGCCCRPAPASAPAPVYSPAPTVTPPVTQRRGG